MLSISKKITIWTKQHKNILDELTKDGRYIAKREYIINKMGEIAHFYLDTYSWYVNKASAIVQKPNDVLYPIWVSLSCDSTLSNDADTVILEIEIDPAKVITFDIEKWGYVVNYLYIPKDKQDEEKHAKLLGSYNVDDPTAYMSNFYPVIRRKIIKSWDRLFEEDGAFQNTIRIGTIWEVKKEWIVKVT